jgi:hypothetical protein
MAPLAALGAIAAACGGDEATYSVWPTSKCLSAKGVRVAVFEAEDRTALKGDPFAASGGALRAKGAYNVTVYFGEDAAEAGALAEKLESHEYFEPFEGREYRMVVRRTGNAVVSVDVPKDEEPTRDLEDVLGAAERCLTAT